MPHILHTKDLGSISLYGDALTGGYDGTKAQLFSLVAGIADGAMLLDIGHRDIVLSAENWNDGEYNLESVLPTNRFMILSVGIDGDEATGTQINEWYNAEVFLKEGNILFAHGTEPTGDIPVSISYQSMIATIAALPTMTGTFTYDGTAQTATWDGYDSTSMTMSGDTQGTNAGTYTTYFTPNQGYKWWDDTKETKAVTWSIEKAAISAPTVTADLTYDGTEQTATVNDYDSSLIRVTGITGINAGDYIATIALIDKTNYRWMDGATTDIEVVWEIAKAAGSITLSADSVELSDDEPSAEITATATGKVTAESKDTSIVKATTDKNVIDIALSEPGAQGITSVSAIANSNTNYTSASVDIIVKANFAIPTWESGTSQQIKNALAAHYAGDINLYDYWDVGDERDFLISYIPEIFPIRSSGTKHVKFVLLHKGGISLADGKECAFVVGAKSIITTGRMTSTWRNSPIRTWCMNSFKEAIQEDDIGIFKAFMDVEETLFTIPSYYAIFSGGYDYYKIASNRKKDYSYWTSTQYGTSSTMYFVNSSGTSGFEAMDRYDGISPQGVI